MQLWAPVDIASLVFFRIAFGAIVLWEVGRYFEYDWIRQYYIDPSFHFTYFGFDWVRPWSGNGMYVHFFVLGALAICIMVGFLYRLSATLFFFGFTYVFLLDETYYLNHVYLICLISLLLIFIPAHRTLSVDAWLRPKIRSNTVPAWALWLLRAQIGLVYFFGGIAKLNADWLHGEPMRMWLAERTDFPLVGALFTQDWMAYLFSYGGLLFDLLFVPFVLWRRTRPFALAVALVFHLVNSRLFSIGIFPWFMIAANLLFLSPGWPRLFDPRRNARQYPNLGEQSSLSHLGWQHYAAVAAASAYLALQVLIPLRHYLYPGDVQWTEEGHRFSWRMKLRDKQGEIHFFATDPVSQLTWEIDPLVYVTERQWSEMVGRPDMVLQLAHHLKDVWSQQGYERVEIRAQVMVSLNGRAPQPLIDPTIDLGIQHRTLAPAPWILPLRDP